MSISLNLYRGMVKDKWFIAIDGENYEALRTMPNQSPEPPDNLLDFLNQDVVIVGLIANTKIHCSKIVRVEDYNPGTPPIIHRQGTTLHPHNRSGSINWRGKWSMTHSLEPPPDETPPWNAAINRNPQAIDRINDFLDVEHVARYKERDDWTCCTIFVSDFTRLMHCEICLDPVGSRKWYNRGANQMIQYIRTVLMPNQEWRRVNSPREAQDRANQGYPVVAYKTKVNEPGHVAMVIPGSLDSEGFPLLAQAGINNSKAWRWHDPEVQYVTHN